MSLTERERRALAHLPRWRSPQDHADAEQEMRDANGYPEDWRLPRSATVGELLARLEADEHVDTPTEAELVGVLEALEARGLVNVAGDAYAMTEQGFEVLTS